MPVCKISGSLQGTRLEHYQQSREGPLSQLQVVRVDRVHTQRFLSTKMLNPEYSVFSLRFLDSGC